MIPPQELILEACLETPEEAHSAFLNGAHRVELCRNLESGGLSPLKGNGSTLSGNLRTSVEGDGPPPAGEFCLFRGGIEEHGRRN